MRKFNSIKIATGQLGCTLVLEDCEGNKYQYPWQGKYSLMIGLKTEFEKDGVFNPNHWNRFA